MPKKKLIDDTAVLEKALLVISKKGPETFSLADIAKEVGLAPSTLLQRFGSKRQLLIAAAKHAHTSLQKDEGQDKVSPLPYREAFISWLCDMFEGVESREDLACSLGLLKLDMVDPELHPIARDLFNELRIQIEKKLIQAQSMGELVDSIDIEATAWEIDAMRHGLVIQWALSGTGTLREWVYNGLQQSMRWLR